MKSNISSICEVSLLLGWIASLIMITCGISMCITETAFAGWVLSGCSALAENVLLSGCLLFVLTFIGLACFYGGNNLKVKA